MSDNSRIEWTDATWSPTLGCTHVSEGCDGCYAMSTVHRMSFNPNEKVSSAAGGLTAYRPGVGVVWTNNVRVLPDRLGLPLQWKKPKRIFVDSQSDLFHDQAPDEFIARVFAVMFLTPQHTFQVLTKRPGRMRALLSSHEFVLLVDRALYEEFGQAKPQEALRYWPLPNVWLGVSVENQKWADVRIPILLDPKLPAAVRFLSCEPLLGPVDLGIGDPHRDHPRDEVADYEFICLTCSTEDREVRWFRRAPDPEGVNWVIVGGESGPGARPMHPDWARSLRDQCQQAKVPFLFKQWGEWGPAPWSVRIPNAHGFTRGELAAAMRDAEERGATHHIQPSGHLYKPDHKTWSLERDADGDYPGAVRRWGKKAAGRELDGRTWDEYPEART